ncbi:hypothetical protein VTK73DRAFT_3195 [Phialemonium thermophilum]|uniref:Secreted protein n=1 Tax=Phialemonium thermophilum TaxID=223376 RepID=A0ABR3VJR8_9PEZI
MCTLLCVLRGLLPALAVVATVQRSVSPASPPEAVSPKPRPSLSIRDSCGSVTECPRCFFFIWGEGVMLQRRRVGYPAARSPLLQDDDLSRSHVQQCLPDPSLSPPRGISRRIGIAHASVLVPRLRPLDNQEHRRQGAVAKVDQAAPLHLRSRLLEIEKNAVAVAVYRPGAPRLKLDVGAERSDDVQHPRFEHERRRQDLSEGRPLRHELHVAAQQAGTTWDRAPGVA